jgi:dolichyl-phosphate beta-glucosyltransferase
VEQETVVTQNERCFLVVPCFNEASRIDTSEFKKWESDNLQILFVDDGSSDKTSEVLKQNFKRHLILPKNQGKAEAVRQGVMLLMQTEKLGEHDWIGFWDADLATPIGEVKNFFIYRKLFMPNAKVVIGSRVARMGAEISRTYKRHYFGRIFATLVDLALKITPYDSQCGAKLFHNSVADKAFSESFISRWLFDVEILFRLRGVAILEYPLQKWTDIEGSKLKMSRELFRVITDIIKIRRKYVKI